MVVDKHVQHMTASVSAKKLKGLTDSHNSLGLECGNKNNGT